MTKIEAAAWQVMKQHAEATFPRECCGVMTGTIDSGGKQVVAAAALDNVYEGGQEDRYEIRPEDLLRVEKEARAAGHTVIGIYHSHPDCDAYFSKTDLEHSCPWYSFVVLSIYKGKFDHANCFLPDADQTHAAPEPLQYPE
jgi:proteasome lid subunit RPN8/RPN11